MYRIFYLFIFFVACSSGGAKKYTLLAEQLWLDGKYDAAVAEFEKAFNSDPKGSVGENALFRAANTEAIFLGRPKDALKKYEKLLDLVSGEEQKKNIKNKIGDLLFEKLQDDERTVLYYQTWLRESALSNEEKARFLYRIGKSQFNLWRFEEAIGAFKQITEQLGTEKVHERAMYDLAVVHWTYASRREAPKNTYKFAIQAFKDFIRRYPESIWVPYARFGVASCYEEQGELELAYQQFLELRATYPSPSTIELKLRRIFQRMRKRL